MDKEYCYASINEEGYADLVQCSTYEGHLEGERVVSIELTQERNQDWYMLRYYDFETGEWGEKVVFPEPEPQPNPWDEEVNQLKLAMAEMAEAHEQEKTEMQLALAELAELVGGEPSHG